MNYKVPRKLSYFLILVLFISCMTGFVWEKLVKNEHLHFSKFLDDLSHSKDLMEHKFRDKPTTDDTYKRRWDYKPQFVKGINCAAIVAGNSTLSLPIYQAENTTAMQYVNMTKNCSNFLRQRSYITDSLTLDEQSFPIAYCIVVYKDVFQVEKLLRAIYRPQNFYCFHIDKKSKQDFHQAISSIASCFSNVFVSEKSVDVRWGEFSLLETQLICMKELVAYKWKYFINLAGQEFPLKTNYEIVQILRAYNNTNDIKCPRGRYDRWKRRWTDAGDPPHGITPHKGPLMMTVTRAFVDYVLHDRRALDFLNWTKRTSVPDETYFNTLHFNTHLAVPGSEYGNFEHEDKLNPTVRRFFARLVVWNDQVACGKVVHGVCILGLRELPMLVSSPQLFANKFLPSYQPLALDCLNEWLYNRTRDYFLHGYTFNTDLYRKKNRFSTKNLTET